MSQAPKIAVIGLGYVGLPLAHALACHFPVTGYDIDKERIQQLLQGHDRTWELSEEEVKNSSVTFTSHLSDTKDHQVYIVTVPTPVTDLNTPDLSLLEKASLAIGSVLSPGALVIYESTVYPGVTEEYCAPLLEKSSGLKCGKDFFVGFSPERINPGDTCHTIQKVTKVVAGQTPEITETMAEIYGKITRVFKAKNIKTAEAAKVIENTQRDVNIAFINEITAIFNNDNLSIYDVLQAAQTKWNFLDFVPGMVGGHCIGVDPYYLAYYSQKLGHHPKIILAGRQTNDEMPIYLADKLYTHLTKLMGPDATPYRVLMMGITFKENIPDLRNSKSITMIQRLRFHGCHVDILDPFAQPQDAQAVGLSLFSALDQLQGKTYHAIVGGVAHTPFKELRVEDFSSLTAPDSLIFDIKNLWREDQIPKACQRLTL